MQKYISKLYKPKMVEKASDSTSFSLDNFS